MLRDWGSWDTDLRAIVAGIRNQLLEIADASNGFECVLLQGSGSYGVEAALGSFAPKDRKTLMLTSLNSIGSRLKRLPTGRLESPSANV